MIRVADADPFRPLNNFLKDQRVKTADRNVELLAWLIGFEPRPYAVWKKNTAPRAVETEAMEPVHLPARAPEHAAGKRTKNWAWAAALALLLAGAGLTWYYFNSGSCMYWAETRYRPAPCSVPVVKNAPVYALDTQRPAHFRKIEKPDTITGRSIGKVWYFKANNEIEYYTGGGMHPVHTERRLKPITAYMINKYIAGK